VGVPIESFSGTFETRFFRARPDLIIFSHDKEMQASLEHPAQTPKKPSAAADLKKSPKPGRPAER